MALVTEVRSVKEIEINLPQMLWVIHDPLKAYIKREKGFKNHEKA